MFFKYKTARQLKEGNSIAAVESLPNPNLKGEKENIVLFVITEITRLFNLARAYYFQI